MNTFRILTGLVGTFGIVFNLSAADKLPLDPHLEPLRPWLEKTWKGEFKNSKPDKPQIDVVCWERALNGKSIRILHSLNNGAYGGEAIVRWNETKQEVNYHYFTTADFTTLGTMTFKDGKLLTHEIVSGNAGGITEVRAEFELRPDGTYHVKSEHLKEGVWSPGRETTYREEAGAKVIFK